MTGRIKPVLSEGEWRALHARTLREFNAAAPLSASVHEAHQLGAWEIPGVIAAANDALPDSDKRKITREKLRMVRRLMGVHEDEEKEFLDALESYLPPE